MEFDATFIIAVISFIVFVLIMNKIFYAPILKIMQERQDIVEQNYIQAKSVREEAQKHESHYETELSKARDEARGKISKEARLLKDNRSKVISDYKDELYNKVSEQKEQLKNSAIEAKDILKNNVLDVADEISLKILGNNIVIEKTQDIDITKEQENG